MSQIIKFKELQTASIVGKKIDITTSDTVFKGRVMSIGKKEMRIVTDENLVSKGDIIKCNFFYQELYVEFLSSIASLSDGVLTIKLPKEVIKLQLRESLRVPCNIKCTLQDITSGVITNISSGGAYVTIHENFSTKEHVGITKSIIFSIEDKPMKIKANILDEGNKFIRLSFKELNEDLEEFIGDYCSRVDAHLFWSSRNDG